MPHLFALIDSGADESFLDSAVVEQLGLSIECLDEPIEAKALDGRISPGHLKNCSSKPPAVR